MLCVSIIQCRGEPRPHWKVQLIWLYFLVVLDIRFIPFLSISFNLRSRWRHQRKSSGQKAGHNWIIPQSQKMSGNRENISFSLPAESVLISSSLLPSDDLIRPLAHSFRNVCKIVKMLLLPKFHFSRSQHQQASSSCHFVLLVWLTRGNPGKILGSRSWNIFADRINVGNKQAINWRKFNTCKQKLFLAKLNLSRIKENVASIGKYLAKN